MAVHIETLANGLRIIVEELPHLRSISLGILVGAGVKDEIDDNSGISHFIEHMLFKGTVTRSARDIAEAFDSIGGRINAHTAKEYTFYYSVVLDEHFDIALEVLSDMLLNSVFKKEELQLESKVVLEEISMYEDTPDELIHDLSAQYIWEGHQLGRSILGSKSSIKKLNREKIAEYCRQTYTPDNVIISVAGDVKTKQAVEEIKKALKNLQGKNKKVSLSQPHIKPGIKLVKKETEQVHLCISTKGVAYQDPSRFTLAVLNNILGGAMSSRLFQKIREQQGLVYSIYSYLAHYHDTGLCSIYAGANMANAQKVIDHIVDELNVMKKQAISAEELIKAKEQLKGNMVLNLESTQNRMSFNAKSAYYYARLLSLDEIFASIDKVSAAEVQRLANEFFNKDKLHLTSIGNFKKKDALVMKI